MSELGHALPLDNIAGWTVTGRHGQLGQVVRPENGDWGTDENRRLLVRGGANDALYFHVPVELVTTVARCRCDLRIDADVSDFTPVLRPDGSVDLFPSER